MSFEGFLPCTTTGLVVVLTSIWMYRKYTFWSAQGMPGPTPIPLLGNILDYVFEAMHIVDMKRHKKYGDVFGSYNGFTRVLNISSPDLIKQTMISDFFTFHGRDPPTDDQILNGIGGQNGQDWKDQRSIVSQAFTSGKLKKMLPLMVECCESFGQYLDSMGSSTSGYDLRKLYGLFILNVTAKTNFGIDVKGHLDEDNQFIKSAMRLFQFPLWKLLVFFLVPRFVKDKLGLSMSPRDAQEYLASAAKEILKQRKENNVRRPYPDMLQLLADASGDNQPDVDDENMEDIRGFKKTSKKKLTEQEIIANVMIFLVVGFDTTASCLSQTTYALATNPDIQDKLRNEVMKAVRESEDGNLSYETIMSLKYLDAVINENLRVYSPGASLQRVSVCDYVLETDSKKYKIPAGTTVSIPIYTIHHNPDYYKDPDTFDPDRWTPERKHEIKPYTYLPFGIGPRNCVAMRFVLFQVKVCLAFLIQKYRFVRTSETAVPLDFSSSTMMLTPKKVVVGFERL